MRFKRSSAKWRPFCLVLNIILCRFLWFKVSVWTEIGIDDIPYTVLSASVAAQLSNCTSLPGPVNHVTRTALCQSGAVGRYLYVYLQGTSGTLHVHELKVYGKMESMLISFLLSPVICVVVLSISGIYHNSDNIFATGHSGFRYLVHIERH